MPPPRNGSAYRELVNELMGFGWYRIGPGPDQDDRKTWGFREGHTIDIDHPGRVIWVPARNETTAMRLMLGELRPHRSGKSPPRSARELGGDSRLSS